MKPKKEEEGELPKKEKVHTVVTQVVEVVEDGDETDVSDVPSATIQEQEGAGDRDGDTADKDTKEVAEEAEEESPIEKKRPEEHETRKTSFPKKEQQDKNEPDDDSAEEEGDEIELEVHDVSGVSARKKHATRDEREAEKEKRTVESIFGRRTDAESAISPEISVHKTASGSRRKVYIWAIGMFFMTVTIALGLLVFGGGFGDGMAGVFAKPTPTPTPTESPTPTPSPEPVSKEDLTIEVLNGSGEAGVASRMKEYLEKGGYTVGNTGNADEYSYEKTEISVKMTAEAILGGLESYLEDEYKIGKAEADLPSDYSNDIRIIVGAE